MLSLGEIVKRQGTEILLNTPLTELVKDEDGRVIGAVVETPDGPVRIARSPRRHPRRRRLRTSRRDGAPSTTASTGYTSAAEGDLGTGIAAGVEAGGAVALMDDAWWGASVPLPDGEALFVLNERSDPFSIVVDQSGERYLNESESYIDFGHHVLERDLVTPANHSWLIVDAPPPPPLHVRGDAHGRQEAARGGHHRDGPDDRGARRADRHRRRRACAPPSSASTASPARASTRTSAAATPSTTTTTATRA